MPKVSVLLTSYNCGDYIAQAIDSILGQTFGDFELLISDDASTDHSRQIIEEFAARDRRIVTFYQAENLGLVRNYNFLFARAKGQFITLQDADDWSDARRLERQVAVLEGSDYALVGCRGFMHYPDGSRAKDGPGRSAIIHGREECPSIPASIMFRAKLLDHVPGWSPYFEGGTSMDRYFLMALLDGRRGYHLGDPLYHARVRAGSNCRVFKPRNMTSHLLFLELARQRRETGTDWLKQGRYAEMARFEEEAGKNTVALAAAMRESAVINVDCGRYGDAAGLLLRSILRHPSSLLTWRSVAYLFRRTLALRV